MRGGREIFVIGRGGRGWESCRDWTRVDHWRRRILIGSCDGRRLDRLRGSRAHTREERRLLSEDSAEEGHELAKIGRVWVPIKEIRKIDHALCVNILMIWFNDHIYGEGEGGRERERQREKQRQSE
jgi:hypothetical protein